MLSHAAVTVLVDDNIKVTAINGQEIKQSVFQPSTKTFTLQPGQHVITAKYDRLYNLPVMSTIICVQAILVLQPT